MPICPDGHDSTDPDFCDICGIRIGGASAPAPDAAAVPGAGQPPVPAAEPAAGAEVCPHCGTSRTGQFCEVCRYDFASGTPTLPPAPAPGPAEPGDGPAPGGPGTSAAGTGGPGTSAPLGKVPGDGAADAEAWTAVVTADRAYFDSVMAEGGPDSASIEFPGYCPERRFRLAGPEMRIGRRSVSRGLQPEIDLTGPPTDPGVSHMHAVLVSEPDGGWAVLDPGSANGTVVNGHEIAPGVRVPLHGGDKVCVGAWTMLTIQVATS